MAYINLLSMRSSEAYLRCLLIGPYGAVASLVMFFYRGDPFCARPGSRNYTLMVAEIAAAIAVFDFVAGVSASIAAGVLRARYQSRWLKVLLTTAIVGGALAYLPFWMYRGYGNFRFQNTAADVSCFFTEANGWFAFPFIVAPLLTLTTFLRELAVRRFTTPNKPQRGPHDLYLLSGS